MAKKGESGKFSSIDFDNLLNSSQFLKNSPKNKKMQKHSKDEESPDEDGNFVKIVDEYQPAKKKTAVMNTAEPRQKLLEVMEYQMGARKKASNHLLSSLSEVLAQQQVLSKNERNLEQLMGAFLKCVQQSNAAAKNNLDAMKEIHADFRKRTDDLESIQRAQNEKLADQLEQDIEKMHQKLVADTKRKQLDSLNKIFNAMQNDI